MKKIILFIVTLSSIFSASAQRVAVLDFNAGAGVSQADVDGISAIFNTYFSPYGYTLVERTSIDRVIDEQNFQRGKMTQSQMVRVGEILNVSKVVIGDVNIIMGQYNIDVRVVNVESGTISAKDGASWNPGDSYRSMMSELASRLASQISINPTSKTTSNATLKTSQPVSKTYKVGDIITLDGMKGVVFAVSSDGKHGRVVNIRISHMIEPNTIKQAADFALRNFFNKGWDTGWRFPNTDDLERLAAVKDVVNESIYFADGERIETGTYWTGEMVKSGYDPCYRVVTIGDDGYVVQDTAYSDEKCKVRFVFSF